MTTTRRKYKIMYPSDHHDVKLQGKPYKAPSESMVVMNGSGVLFLYHGEQYYPWIQPLSVVLPKYDLIWK